MSRRLANLQELDQLFAVVNYIFQQCESQLNLVAVEFLDTAVPAVMKHGRDTALPCPYED
jgi:hypothetical protein